MLRMQFYLKNGKMIKNHLCISQSQIFIRNYSDDKTKENKDFYDVLGLKSTATHSEIKKAYYDLTFKFHPDKNEGNSDASTKFREVSEAYEVLGNYSLRKRYDKGLPLPLMKTKSSTTQGVIVEKEVKYQKFFDSRTNAPKFGENVAIEENKSDEYQETHEKHFNDQLDKSKSNQVPVVAFVVLILLLKVWYDS